jgi:hypothetical protein
LRGDLLPQRGMVAEFLGQDALDRFLGLRDEIIELLAGAHVQVPETIKKLPKVIERGITEDFGLAVVATA